MRLSNLRRVRMPSPDDMARRARDQLPGLPSYAGSENPYDPSYLKDHFDGVLIDLLGLEYRLYKEEERRVCSRILAEVYPEASSMRDFWEEVFDDLYGFFLGVAQSRKQRAGGSFERHVHFLFEKLGYPFDKQVVINGKPDFIMPSAERYRQNPADVILFTAKRTLRERWRQIVIEGIRTPQYFLGTIDEELSGHIFEEMRQHRIYAVVPAAIIEKYGEYRDAPNVISFRNFFRDWVDPAMSRWRNAGIVS